MKLELLSPAKNLEFGREAINHGADAVYIGAPAYGARAAATNTIDDIDALAQYAHLYGSKVFVTVNTLLFDDEIEPAVNMIWRLYDVGVDALIIQDMGLLECDLPPVELHASTQCHNADVERIKFMESVGFRRVILARETSLEQMRAIRAASGVDIEAFVHGALCVSYSGQCYMSQYLNGRSGNRGCCSQPCRSSYDLMDGDGRILIKDRHLLSLRDFNASQQLRNMINAGITSFKIEGRLKDLGYVKNITAYYRQLLDNMMDGHMRASSGSTTFTFTPDPERTFNRGYTDYFLRSRQPMASFATQKSLGKRVGEVSVLGRNSITVRSDERFSAGDGLCFFDSDERIHGFLVNEVHGNVLIPNVMPNITVGTVLWRNNDIQFERLLKGRSADRRIGIEMWFGTCDIGFVLKIKDEDDVEAVTVVETDQVLSSGGQEKMTETIMKQLSKVGDTPFRVDKIVDSSKGRFFLPAAVLNQLRRDAIAALIQCRIKHFRPEDILRRERNTPVVAEKFDYHANVINKKSESFYQRHGAKEIERGLEETHSYDGKALMTTKYCLRYELGCCLKNKAKTKRVIEEIKPTDSLVLCNNDRRFLLEFDCGRCMMRIYKSEK